MIPVLPRAGEASCGDEPAIRSAHAALKFQPIVQRTNPQLKVVAQTERIAGASPAAARRRWNRINQRAQHGDKVLCGNRNSASAWCEGARAYGLELEVIERSGASPWILKPSRTRPLNPDHTDKSDPGRDSSTHSELSTGRINDLETIARHVHAHRLRPWSLLAVHKPWRLQRGRGPPWAMSGGPFPERVTYACLALLLRATEPAGLEKPGTLQYSEFYFPNLHLSQSRAKDSNPSPSGESSSPWRQPWKMMQAEGLKGIFARHAATRALAQAA